MLMKGVSEVVDKLKSIPNIPSEVMSGLRSKESLEDKPSRPGYQSDADSIEINTVFDKAGVSVFCCMDNSFKPFFSSFVLSLYFFL